ncbi:MAG: DNA-3-methyladenine glycosylase 2 family protein [Planctomycetales bacterium]|nr:DNA-3-methyladenine glycosylase 2 family protein [Planctomycetales bacterium]
MTQPNGIDSQKSFARKLRKAERHLIGCDARLTAWITKSGRCELEVAWDRSLYEALVRAIAHQQLHGRAAASILGRLVDAYSQRDRPFPTPRQLARAEPDKLRSFGFSSAKVIAIQGIAAAAERGEVPTRVQAAELSDEELIEHLLPLRGVGRWTVEMLLIFTLGRLDVMPTDDFGIRSGLQHLAGLTDSPRKGDFSKLTDHWAPYRSVAAWYLWRLADSRKAGG